MKGRLFPIAVLAASLFMAACLKSESDSAGKPHGINGQVFVIRKDRVNVKLGGGKSATCRARHSRPGVAGSR